jgi:hypothetical protein
MSLHFYGVKVRKSKEAERGGFPVGGEPGGARLEGKLKNTGKPFLELLQNPFVASTK